MFLRGGFFALVSDSIFLFRPVVQKWQRKFEVLSYFGIGKGARCLFQEKNKGHFGSLLR